MSLQLKPVDIYTRAGEVRISARETGSYLAVSVTDTRIGIPSAEQEKIFQYFFQVNGAADRQYSGTGIGLAITRKLVELQEGNIRVESEPGRGSCFTFTLPLANETAAGQDLFRSSRIEKQEQLLPMIPPIASQGNREQQPDKVLLVDDDPVNLQVLSGYLELHNFTPLLAADGNEALQIIMNYADFIEADLPPSSQ